MKSPTNLLTVLSAVNRHTAYMDSILDVSQSLNESWYNSVATCAISYGDMVAMSA